MTPVSSPMLATGSLVQTHGTDREKLAAVAKQFEGIFVRQMLAAARKADFGDPLLGGQALDTFRTMQDEHFADLAAQDACHLSNPRPCSRDDLRQLYASSF